MGYKIVYNQSGMQQSKILVPTKHKRKLWPVFVIVTCILTAVIWNKVQNQTNRPTATEEAFSTFAENLKEGKGLGESFTVFCKEIITNAEQS